MSAEPVPAPAVTPAWRGKKIVIFADGTGNSFTTQESNIWRLYAALDKTEKSGATPAELQLARYSPGVGTASNRVLRLIDGATGIGVPSKRAQALPLPLLELAAGGRDLSLRLLARGLHGADAGGNAAVPGADALDDR